MWYFSSDWHLCHTNIIKETRRDFASQDEKSMLDLADRGVIPYSEVQIDKTRVEEMNSTIIDSTNAVVDEKDSLVLLGDFCWSKKIEVAKSYLDRLKCKNIYMVWGNHDKPQIMSSLFKASYYQYLWTVEGQKIFTSHFPCRVWDRSHHGSWMLYGHCHNSLWNQDNFELDSEVEKSIDIEFLKSCGLSENQTNKIFENVKKGFVRSHGLRLTLDVGVDNKREGRSFGTPWSFEEIQDLMRRKREKWFSLC